MPLVTRVLAHGQPTDQEDAVRPRHLVQEGQLPNGRGVRVAIRPGFEVSAYDLVFAAASGSSAVSEPCVSIVVLLDGEGQGWMGAHEGAPTLTYAPGTVYINIIRRSTAGRASFPAGAVFRFIDLRLTLESTSRLGLGPPLDRLTPAHPVYQDGDVGLWLGQAPASAELMSEAWSLFKAAFQPGEADLLVEASALNILRAVVDLLAIRPSAPGSADLAVRDEGRLAQARQLLEDDLAAAWTIAELARRVGLNQKRLKAGFKAAHGAPVYAYLQRARLRRARALLSQGRCSVTAIAQSVGYANLSHFAGLFRREFGVLPSRLAERAASADGPPARRS